MLWYKLEEKKQQEKQQDEDGRRELTIGLRREQESPLDETLMI